MLSNSNWNSLARKNQYRSIQHLVHQGQYVVRESQNAEYVI